MNDLVGGDFRVKFEQYGGLFEYRLFCKDNLILVAGDMPSYDACIRELSEIHEALRAIFG